MSTKFLIDVPRNRPPRTEAKVTQPTPQPARVNVALIVVLVIAIIIIVIVVILLIVSGSSSSSDSGDGKCTDIASIPNEVTSTFDRVARTTTISWKASSKAKSYNVYSKIDDPAVSKTNFDKIVNTTDTTINFSSLSAGTHYYIVTAVNECGESDESKPAVIAVSCGSIPTTPPSPVVEQDANDCIGPLGAELIEITFPNANLVGGGYILQGNGQTGGVGDYLVALPQESYGPVSGITQTCNGASSAHVITNIEKLTPATVTSTLPSVTSNTYTVKWTPLVGADEYVVYFVAAAGPGFYYYGAIVPAGTTSVDLPTSNGLSGIMAEVYGYKLCDKSITSNRTQHQAPTIA